MSLPILLSIAYAMIAALLLVLCLSAAFSYRVKLAAVLLVSGFYIFAYLSVQDLRGWAVASEPPSPFKLHWAVVEEPNKTTGSDGAIYILAQGLGEYENLLGVPRLYLVPFSPELAEQIDAALNQIENGEPLEGTLTRKAATPDDDEQRDKNDAEQDGIKNNSDDEVPHFTFRRIERVGLPPKD